MAPSPKGSAPLFTFNVLLYTISMLYTRKGDTGTTKMFNSGPGVRLSKSSAIAEALGSLDEANSYTGVTKSKVQSLKFEIQNTHISEILHDVQNDLFIIQAQVAGADKKIAGDKVERIEKIIDTIEKDLPPIKTFLIPGTNEISAHFDFTRTLVRRAERRVVAVHEAKLITIDPYTLVYLNRLSSLFYAFARISALQSGNVEHAPTY